MNYPKYGPFIHESTGDRRVKMIESLTEADRNTLENCYQCKCNNCVRRHEAIAKALRIIDGYKEYDQLYQSAIDQANTDIRSATYARENPPKTEEIQYCPASNGQIRFCEQSIQRPGYCVNCHRPISTSIRETK